MNYDYFEITDEQFLKTIRFHSKLIKKYLENTLYDFIAFYIAKGIENKAIFDNNYERIVNTSLEYFDSYQFRNSINYKKIKKILKNKYNLIIEEDYPLKINAKKND